jgi:hypothetical protein
MAFEATFQEFTTELVTKGRGKYEKGVVTYTYQGQNKQGTMVDFSNPQVFKLLKTLKSGTPILVTTAKNAGGYDFWQTVKVVDENAPMPEQSPPKAAGAPSSVRVGGSNYETPEERKQRQLYIIRQSSISNAIESLVPGSKVALDSAVVLELAQKYVDFVYGVDELVKDATPTET